MLAKIKAKYDSLSDVARASFWFTICNCISSGISYISLPFFTRLMSSEQYGQITVYNSWVQLFSVFATLNLAAGAFNNGMVQNPDDRDRYSSSMQGLLLAVCSSVGIVVVAAACLFPDLLDMPTSFVGLIFVQIFANGIFALYAARQRYEYKYTQLLGMTFVFAVMVTALAVVAVALTPGDSDKSFVKISSSAFGGLAVALLIVFLTQRKSPRPFVSAYWKFAFNFSVPLIPHYLSLIVLGQIDRIMIGDMVGESEAAYYAVAYTTGVAMSIVTGALNSSMVPWQFERIKAARYEGISKRVSSLVLLVCIASVVVALLSPELLLIAAPSDYQDAVVVIPPVIMGVVFTFIYNLLSNYEFYFMANKFISLASAIAAVANIILNLLFLPVFGYLAAAYNTVACYALLAFAHTIFSRRVCAKNVGGAVANKLFGAKSIWGIALATCAVMLVVTASYPYPIVRYAVILVFAAVGYRKRQWIISLLREE